MPAFHEIDFVFFDIGGTLGDRNANGTFVPFLSSAGLLKAMRDELGLRVGIITTLGPQLSNPDGLALLKKAGLNQFLDPAGFVSDHDAGVAKPSLEIYHFAAERVGVPLGRCLFVGENLIEVIGAIAAGMKAILKPCPPGRDLPS
ncbi:MAG TPA: HAD family hydrolase [Pyrinomonadaceae bacterium]|nr:HAD family hydrolase [Pyrinomonadaceae bacterium]